MSDNNIENIIEGNISNDIIYEDQNDRLDTEEALLNNFIKGLNNNELENMVEAATFFSYDDEIIMKEIIKKDNVEYIQLFVGLGYKIPKNIEENDVINYILTNKTPRNIKYIIDNIEYNSFNANNRNKNLLLACKLDIEEIINKLLEFDYDLGYTDNMNNTYFIWCCAKGNLNLVKKFIELGIDINIKTCQGYCGIQYAIIYNKPNIVEYLFNNINNDIIKFIEIYNNIKIDLLQDNNQDIFINIIKTKELKENEIKECIMCYDKKILEYIIEKYYNYSFENPLIYYILNCPLFDYSVGLLEEKKYDFENVKIRDMSLFGYIFSYKYNLSEQYYRLKKYINKENMNHRNIDGYIPLISLLNLSMDNIEDIIDEIIETNVIDYKIYDNEGLTCIDHLIINGYYDKSINILSANNIKIMEYLKNIDKGVLVNLIEYNYEIYDLILMDDSINIRDYLEYPRNDILELGLIKNQINPYELINYDIDFNNISSNKILLKAVLQINRVDLIENIILKLNHLLEYVNLDIIEIYNKKNNKSILEFMIKNCYNQKQIIYILKKIYNKEKLNEHISEKIWSKIIKKKYDLLIIYLIKMDIKPNNMDEIIEKIDLNTSLFDENILEIIFNNIKDNKLLLKYLFKNSKIENIILKSAKSHELTDNCIICYGKDIERHYYYKCEHDHNYHFDCLIPYLKKHNMIDMKCFFCKGNVCFSKIYKN
jgi:ankyrin repeat protein